MKIVADSSAALSLESEWLRCHRCHPKGFTRLELLVVVATVFALALLAAPALGSGRVRATTQSCQLNFQDLTRAWLLYAEDNQGRLTANLGSSVNSPTLTWCAGWLQKIDASPDNTNTVHLAQGQLGKYVSSIHVFRCPADTSTAPKTQGVPRVRSVSMNTYMGQKAVPYTSGYRQFRTLSSILLPTPAKAFVFIDEHEASINDSIFEIDMKGFEPDTADARIIVDYPADRHEGGAVLSFADGHVEDWRWMDTRTRPSHALPSELPLVIASPGNVDVRRLQSAASYPDRPTTLPSQP